MRNRISRRTLPAAATPIGEQDFGHYYLEHLNDLCEFMNRCTRALRSDGHRSFTLEQIWRKANQVNPQKAREIHLGFFTFNGREVEISEKAFFEFYGKTDAGKYAKKEMEKTAPGSFGHFAREKEQ